MASNDKLNSYFKIKEVNELLGVLRNTFSRNFDSKLKPKKSLTCMRPGDGESYF